MAPLAGIAFHTSRQGAILFYTLADTLVCPLQSIKIIGLCACVGVNIVKSNDYLRYRLSITSCGPYVWYLEDIGWS